MILRLFLILCLVASCGRPLTEAERAFAQTIHGDQLNAALGTRLGSPAAAATILFVIAFGTAATVFVLTGAHGLAKLSAAPKHLLLAGVLIAFYVLTITYIAPHFGVGNAVFFVLLGQLISAAAIDHFGLFGAQATSLSATRMGGIALMAAGVWLTQLA